jgi:microcystin-dependent protein
MDEMMGTVKLFAGNFAPKGFMACDGTLIPIQTNTALFSILGTTYGGDGKATFALPKLQAPIEGLMYIICTMGIYPSRP